MMDIVTFETAKRLKEAGFPQPEFAPVQMWYNQYGAITFLSKKEVAEEGTHVYFFCISVVSGRTDRIVPIHDGAFFAPTATDILRELGREFDLHFHDSHWIAAEDDKYQSYIEHESPAEACALAWLQLNSK